MLITVHSWSPCPFLSIRIDFLGGLRGAEALGDFLQGHLSIPLLGWTSFQPHSPFRAQLSWATATATVKSRIHAAAPGPLRSRWLLSLTVLAGLLTGSGGRATSYHAVCLCSPKDLAFKTNPRNTSFSHALHLGTVLTSPWHSEPNWLRATRAKDKSWGRELAFQKQAPPGGFSLLDLGLPINLE